MDVGEVKDVEEVEVEEWPSIAGLGEGVVAEESKADVNKVQAEGFDSTDAPQAEDGPLLVIPGLELVSRADVEQKPEAPVSDVDQATCDELESLGELRFADPD